MGCTWLCSMTCPKGPLVRISTHSWQHWQHWPDWSRRPPSLHRHLRTDFGVVAPSPDQVAEIQVVRVCLMVFLCNQCWRLRKSALCPCICVRMQVLEESLKETFWVETSSKYSHHVKFSVHLTKVTKSWPAHSLTEYWLTKSHCLPYPDSLPTRSLQYLTHSWLTPDSHLAQLTRSHNRQCQNHQRGNSKSERKMFYSSLKNTWRLKCLCFSREIGQDPVFQYAQTLGSSCSVDPVPHEATGQQRALCHWAAFHPWWFSQTHPTSLNQMLESDGSQSGPWGFALSFCMNCIEL